MRKHFQSTYYLLYMCMYIQKFHVILPSCHNLHISLLREKRIVQTKNNHLKVVTFVVMPWLMINSLNRGDCCIFHPL